MKHFAITFLVISCFAISSKAQTGRLSTGIANTAQASSKEISSNYSSNSAVAHNDPAYKAEAQNYTPAFKPFVSNNVETNNIIADNPNANEHNSNRVVNNRGINYNNGSAVKHSNNAANTYAGYSRLNRYRSDKKHKEHCDSACMHCPHICLGLHHVPQYEVYYEAETYFDDLGFYTEYVPYDNSALNLSLVGYVVYNGDTVSGTITLTNNSVFLQQPTAAKNEYGYRYSVKDYALKSVVVFDGGNELFLTRPTANEELLRVLHAGKLCIYDNRYSFPTVYNINKGHLAVACDGQFKQLSSFVVLDARHPLMKAVNKAYGLNLKTGDMSWNGLFGYINKLD